jgi:catechol 2,3-dioxygenase-like lactoylglutathione lyase family enzyme
MSSGIKTIVYPVQDLAKAKALYAALTGAEPYADQPYYVGIRVDDGQEIGLDPHVVKDTDGNAIGLSQSP